jgi:hypothetical protein
MAKVITFSRQFPSNHPRAGEPTWFIEKIYASLADTQLGFKIPNDANNYWDWHEYYNCTAPKYHTIRADHRFKVGDKFSPRIWSGKPYRSKQLIIGPDIEIKKVWDFRIKLFNDGWWIDFGSHRVCGAHDFKMSALPLLARNDGLELADFLSWFQYHTRTTPFLGQIICWNDKINY